MAISYGFFNSINHDRTYNADQMSEYFDGLVSNGVYESVGSAMQVTAGEGLAVNVQSGRAIIDCKWIKNDAAQAITLTTAHVLLPRYTAIVIRLDRASRMISIVAKDGTPASDPEKPSMTDDGQITELCLAYVYVGANASTITQANITDMRSSDLCGWVTGVVQQVDTSQLFAQYQAAFEQNYAQQLAWQQNIQTQFDAWFAALTQQLSVNTFIQKFALRTVLSSGSESPISVIIENYAYREGDIIEVYINGLYASEGVDYTLTMSGSTPVITPVATEAGTVVNINVYKSRIGWIALETNAGALVVTNDDAEISL
jgi:hypothetical protein